jgi:hypothetical protein
VDFVVVGLGLGALGVLLGVVMMGWLAPRRERLANHAPSPESAAYDRAIAAERRGIGQALLYAGGAIILATIGSLAGSLDDRTGAFFVATTATVGALGILVWDYLRRSRHPLPRRPRPPARVDTLDGPRPAHLDDSALLPAAADPSAAAPLLAIFAEPGATGDTERDDNVEETSSDQSAGDETEARHSTDSANRPSWPRDEEAGEAPAAIETEVVAAAAPGPHRASARAAHSVADENGSGEG